MYILEESDEEGMPLANIAVGNSAFALAEHAVSLCQPGWRLERVDEGFVIRGPNRDVWYWITPILQIHSVGE